MPEQQNIEYKSSWQDDYLKWICGFANAQSGRIYIGKDNNGSVIGVESYKKLMDDIPNKIKNNCNKQILNRHFSVKLNRHIIIETISLYY